MCCLPQQCKKKKKQEFCWPYVTLVQTCHKLCKKDKHNLTGLTYNKKGQHLKGGISVQWCAFYLIAIINGNRIHSKTSWQLSWRINHAVVTEQGTMALWDHLLMWVLIEATPLLIQLLQPSLTWFKIDKQAFSWIVRENYISTDVKLIKCNEIRTTCVYLKDVGLVQNLLCIQPYKCKVDWLLFYFLFIILLFYCFCQVYAF